MPPVRCWYYEDDGTPKGAGCLRQGRTCNFVHPDEPGWKSAHPSRNARRGSHSRGGYTHGESSTSRYQDSSRHHVPTPRRSSDTTSYNSLIRGDTGWGNETIDNKGWGGSSSYDAGDNHHRGWGEDIGGGADAESNATRKGKNKESQPETGGGWGLDVPEIHAQSSKGPGTRSGTSEDIWPADSANKRRDNREDVNSTGWGRSSFDDSFSTKEREPSKLTTGSNHIPITTRKPDIPTEPPAPKSLPSNTSKSHAPPLESSAPTMTFNVLQSYVEKNLSRANQTPMDISLFKGPNGRALWNDIVSKNIIAVIRAQAQLQRALEEEENWKRTQASPHYSRASLATREKLDAIRVEYSTRVLDSRKRINAGLKALTELPDLSARPANLYPQDLADLHRQLISYIEELKVWVKDIKSQHQLLKERMSATAETIDLTGNFGADTDTENAPTIKEFRKQGVKVALEQLKAATARLQSQAEILTEEVYAAQYINYFDMKEVMASMRQEAKETLDQREDAKAEVLATKADNIGTTLENQAIVASQFIKYGYTEHERAVKEHKELNEIYTKAEAAVSEAKKLQEEMSKQIKELTLKVQNIHSQPQAAPQQKIDIDHVIELTRKDLQDHIQKEMIPIMEGFLQGCVENNENVKREVMTKLGPIIHSATLLREVVESRLQAAK